MKQVVQEQQAPRSFWKDESGDFGVKQIAATVAVIVVIGLVITGIKGNLETWIDEIWTFFMQIIKQMTGSAG